MTPHFVRTGYFELMRTRLLEGRTFTDDDHRPESRAIVIDQVLARKAFPGQSVRMAFGAPTTTIFRLFIGQGLKLSGIGVLVGAAAAIGLTRWMSSMLVGVTPTDLPTYVAIAILFITMAALASWIPARRAAALDPVAALREE